MIERVRIVVLLARPSALVIFGLFAATGLAQAGAPEDGALLAQVLIVVVAFMLSCVTLNDLADRAIDEVNLPCDRTRPLVSGSGAARDFLVIAASAASVAVIVGALLSALVAAVVLAGLAFSAGYSLRPVRIADRGALASLLLPFGYVAVPYLIGILSVRNGLRSDDLVVGAALYVGFVGRILLKDFRDVRGDALFGKRTFLVRHGRRWTCAFSAVCWVVGTGMLAASRGTSWPLVATYAVYVAAALCLLHALSINRCPRRDERLISAIALVGRGTVVTLLAHLSLLSAGWSAPAAGSVIGVLMVLTVGGARTMSRDGPRTRALRTWRITDVGEEPLAITARHIVDVDDHVNDVDLHPSARRGPGFALRP